MAADAIAAEFSKLEELQRHVSYYQVRYVNISLVS